MNLNTIIKNHPAYYDMVGVSILKQPDKIDPMVDMICQTEDMHGTGFGRSFKCIDAFAIRIYLFHSHLNITVSKTLDSIRKEIKKNNPVIICSGSGKRAETLWNGHYVKTLSATVILIIKEKNSPIKDISDLTLHIPPVDQDIFKNTDDFGSEAWILLDTVIFHIGPLKKSSLIVLKKGMNKGKILNDRKIGGN